MPTQQEPVVGHLARQWQDIAALGAELEDDEWDMPSECPGWAVRDLVSHMVGTELSLLGEPAPEPAPAADHIRNGVGLANEAWVRARRGRPGAQVLAEFQEVTARRLAALGELDDTAFSAVGPSPVGIVAYREFMSVRVMDCWVHEQDMRVATGRPTRHDGEPAALAMGRIVSAMPFVVGKKAQAPEGSVVRFQLTGDAPRRLDIAVRQGRAAPLTEDDTVDDPTTTLTMSSDVFWRLGCGRVEGDRALDAGLVVLSGDESLGRAVTRSMAFMI